jgi:cytochrome P450
MERSLGYDQTHLLPLIEPASIIGRAIATLIPALLVLPLLRLFRITGFFRSFPRIAGTLILAILGYLAFLGLAGIYLPSVLPALDALAIAAIVAACWICRPAYGVSRGLPPGSFSPVASMEAIFDHRFYLKQARKHGPIFKMLQFHRPVVCIVGLRTGHELVHLPDTVLAPAPQPFSAEIPGGFLRYMDHGVHMIYGARFRAAFSPSVANASEPVIREAIRYELDRMAENSVSSRGVDPRGYLYRAVFVSFARAVFGFLPNSVELERFQSFCAQFNEQDLSRRLTPRTKQVLGDLRKEILQRADRFSGDTRLTCVLTEWLQTSPGTIDQTALDNMMFVFRFGVDNVSSLLRWILKMLGDHPRWGERVRYEGVDLAERIVMETLRLEQSEYIYRMVRSTLPIHNHRIPPGWIFRLCVRESHLDPDVFDNPETFNPDRFLDRKVDRAAYSPFGTDRHACVAIHATHTVARMFVEELGQNYDWKITSDGPRERPARHWHHWEPSSRFSLCLTRSGSFPQPQRSEFVS